VVEVAARGALLGVHYAVAAAEVSITSSANIRTDGTRAEPTAGGSTLVESWATPDGRFPFPLAQLAAFSRAKDELDAARIKVAALSVDDEATSAALAEKLRITFPLGHGANADEVAAAVGAYVDDEPRYLQSTGFVLAPDGSVVTAAYSSGAIGRLLLDDVVGLVQYIQQQA
jgi:hypothetical protein